MQKSFALATLALGTLIGSAAAQAAVLPAAAPIGPDATLSEARRALEAVGFRQVSGLSQSGNIIRATAVYQDEPVRFIVDARNGRIIDQAARAAAISVTPATSDAAIRTQLAGLGYTGIGEVTRRGNIYVVPAQRAGDRIELRVNATTGRVTDGTTPLVEHIAARDEMNADYVAQQLRLLGYGPVGSVTRSGNVYRATASKAGAPVTLRIDGMTGAVTQ